MSYLSLERKYRPQTFDEILSQEHIITTLKNAISMDRVTHAYLFTGPRGVGKTSTARILAKSLNCEKGPTSTPCNSCLSCQEISQGISMDVIEIDGASNRGIDEMRNLKENIKFASVHGKFRMYIIDEVHMLTQEAFNALLKTLEEPPRHVKFLFATTRPYKVLPTIISRCQRFDFRKIPTRDIAKKLEEIREKEKLDLNNEAIFLIAKAADGSLRDAEVILDQLLSFTKGKVRSEDVAKILGLLEQDILFDIADCMLNGEREKILCFINELIQSGRDPIFIASSIIEHFRNLMVAKIAENSKSFVALPEEDYYRLQQQSQQLSLDEILYITYTLSATIDLIKKTSLAKIPLEISLIKLTGRERLTSVKDVLNRLSAIEKSLKGDFLVLPEEKEPEKTMEVPAPSVILKDEVAAEKDILLLQKIRNSWSGILNFIKSKKMSVATFLSEAQLVRVKDNVLVVGFDKNSSLHREALTANANRNFVQEAIRNVTGESISLSIESLENQVGQRVEMTDLEENETEEIAQNRPGNVEPIVESALDIFDGKIIGIKKDSQKEKE